MKKQETKGKKGPSISFNKNHFIILRCTVIEFITFSTKCKPFLLIYNFCCQYLILF